MSALIILSAVLFFNLVNAFFSLESNFDLYSEIYAPLEILKGKLSFGLINEPGDSYLTAEINGKKYPINIYNFLSSSNANFTCSPKTCEDVYSVSGGPLRDITLQGSIDNYIGFKISEQSSGITQAVDPGIIFSIMPNENFGSYCGEVPVEVDILNDGIVDWAYINPGNYCSNYIYSSCYTPSTDSIIMDYNDVYCQKTEINPTSKLLVGADVIKMVDKPSKNLSLFVYDINSDLQSDSCTLNSYDISKDIFEKHECEVSFTVKSKDDYYLCIRTENNDEYRLRSEQNEAICGYAHVPNAYSLPIADFAVYARIAEISPFTGVKINSTEFSAQNPSKNLVSYINDYLSDRYNNDCGSGKECIIPIKIKSQKKVTIPQPPVVDELMQIKIRHGLTKIIDSFYKLKKESFKISMLSQTFDIEKLNIQAPKDFGQYALKMSIGYNYIAPSNGSASGGKKFSVASLPKIEDLNPKNVFVSFKTPFLLNASSPINISRYEWDFGDGIKENSSIKLIEHTYENIGNYTITITVVDIENNNRTKDFQISVKTSRDMVEHTLKSKKDSISEFSLKLMSIPEFEREIISNLYNIEDMTDDLNSIEKSFNSKISNGNISDSDLYLIKGNLDLLKIPIDIKTSLELKKTSYVVPSKNIMPEILSNIGAGKSSSEDSLKEAILSWQASNLDIKIEGRTKKVSFDDLSTEDLFTVLNIEINPLSSLNNVYLAAALPKGVDFSSVKFEKPYGQIDAGNAVGIKFDSLNSKEIITFAMPGNQEILMDIFASTDFSSLEEVKLTNCGNNLCDGGESYKNCPEDCKRTATAFTLIALFILGGAVGIFLIWKFYASVYDLMLRKRLFKTREEYLNVLIYISNRLRSGKSSDDIRETLNKAGWNKNQLDFVMRKSLKSYKKVKKHNSKVL